MTRQAWQRGRATVISSGIAVAKTITGFLFAGLCVALMQIVAYPAAATNILVLETLTLPIVQNSTKSFKERLAELGFEDGKNGVRFTTLNAEGNQKKATSLLVDALQKEKPDLVVTVATLASRAARDLLDGKRDIPQVFMLVADPIGEGFTPGIDQPSNNYLTGRTHVLSPTIGLGLLQEAMGKDRPLRLGILHSDYPSAISMKNQLLGGVDAFPNISMFPMPFTFVPGAEGRAPMLDAASKLVEAQKGTLDGLILPAGPNAANIDFVMAINKLGIPVLMGSNSAVVKAGALLSVVSTPYINGREVADIAASILAGSEPDTIPISRPASFQINVNIDTAKKLGIALPSHVLELAGDNVYP